MSISLTSIPAICLLLMVGGCSKSGTSAGSTVSNTTNLAGNWKWNYSRTGWGGISFPGTDTTVMLSLYPDSTYSVSLNAQMKSSGHFSVQSTPPPNGITIIVFNTYSEAGKLKLYKQEMVTGLSNGTLSLSDYNIADGSTHFFIINR